MRKIQNNDDVIVIAGKDKGKRGKVSRVVDNNTVIVSGVNMVKKHTKPNPQMNVAGGIVEKEAAIQVSNIAIVNPETNKADRVGFTFEEGKKIRVFKSNGKPV